MLLWFCWSVLSPSVCGATREELHGTNCRDLGFLSPTNITQALARDGRWFIGRSFV